MAQTRSCNKYGCIDHCGKEIIPCIYDYVDINWELDIIKAKIKDEDHYISRWSGKEISRAEYNGLIAENWEPDSKDLMRDTWWALTDGQYGDMPENWDEDTDFLGY